MLGVRLEREVVPLSSVVDIVGVERCVVCSVGKCSCPVEVGVRVPGVVLFLNFFAVNPQLDLAHLSERGSARTEGCDIPA